MPFQDDQNEDIAELKTLTREDAEAYRQVEKHEADALKETCSLQVIDKSQYMVYTHLLNPISIHVSEATDDVY